MISPAELTAYVDAMRTGGVHLFECEGMKILLGPKPHMKDEEGSTKGSPTSDYKSMLFAATEGIEEEPQ